MQTHLNKKNKFSVFYSIIRLIILALTRGTFTNISQVIILYQNCNLRVVVELVQIGIVSILTNLKGNNKWLLYKKGVLKSKRGFGKMRRR